MSRYTKGWVKLHRSAVESDLSQNVYLWGIWTHLIAIANWQESKIIWKGKQRVLPPGSVVFGIQALADQWDCSHTTIRKWLHYLQDSERIAIESSTRGSLVTICNWEVYQTKDDEVLTPSLHQVYTKFTPSVNQVLLNEEGKKERKKKEESRLGDPKPFPPLVELWNFNRGKLPAVKGCEGKRLKEVERAWKGHPEPEYWIQLIAKLLASEFCTGKNDRGWTADFDFLIRPGNDLKILEGKYDNKTTTTTGESFEEYLKKKEALTWN